MTGVDLTPFVGKKVAVQLAPGLMWMVVEDIGDRPQVKMVRSQDGGGGAVGTPYIEGEVVGADTLNGPRLRIKHDKSKRYLEVALVREAIFAVTVLGDPVVHEPVGSGLIHRP